MGVGRISQAFLGGVCGIQRAREKLGYFRRVLKQFDEF
jgi:hypothetical protein